MIVVIRRSRQLYSDAVTDYMTGCVDHLILGAASYQTDYQVLIRVYRGYGANSSNSVYIPPSECRSDFSDVRFADTAGRLLPYWIETTGTNYVDIWVKLYQIPTTGAVVRVLFGGGAIPAYSNGTSTFPFYDNFDGSALGAAWSLAGAPTITVANSTCTVHAVSAAFQGVMADTSYGTTYAVRAYAKCSYNGGYTSNYPVFGLSNSGMVDREMIFWNQTASIYGQNQASSTASNYDTTVSCANTYHYFDLMRNASTSCIVKVDGANTTTMTSNLCTTALYPFLGANGTTNDLIIDWFVVRKLIYPEPSHGWWGIPEDL